MAALQNPGRVHPLAAWSWELPGPEGELRNIWPLSGRVGGRAWGQSWPPPPAGGRCPGGLRVVRRCVQLEGTLRQDEDWGLLGVRARRPSQGPAREAFGDSCGRPASLQERPQPLCVSQGERPAWAGASLAREGLHQPLQPCWLRSRAGSGASPAVLNSANLSFQQSSNGLAQRRTENKTELRWRLCGHSLCFPSYLLSLQETPAFCSG